MYVNYFGDFNEYGNEFYNIGTNFDRYQGAMAIQSAKIAHFVGHTYCDLPNKFDCTFLHQTNCNIDTSLDKAMYYASATIPGKPIDEQSFTTMLKKESSKALIYLTTLYIHYRGQMT